MKPIFMAFALTMQLSDRKRFCWGWWLQRGCTQRLVGAAGRCIGWSPSRRSQNFPSKSFTLPISHHSGNTTLRDHRKGDQVGRETVEGQGLGRPGLECSTFHGFCWCLCRYLSHKRWRSMQLLPGVDPRSVTFADMESLVMHWQKKWRCYEVWCCRVGINTLLNIFCNHFQPCHVSKSVIRRVFWWKLAKIPSRWKSGVSESVVIWRIGECLQVQRLPPSWRCQGLGPSSAVVPFKTHQKPYLLRQKGVTFVLGDTGAILKCCIPRKYL